MGEDGRSRITENRALQLPDVSRTMKEDQSISISLVLFWTFWSLFVLSALGTLGMLFFGFGTVQESERPLLISAFLVETAVAIGALFYSLFNLRKPSDKGHAAHDVKKQLSPLETVSTEGKSDVIEAEYNIKDEELVRSLNNLLINERFAPDLVIGIARGGLIVAGYLSKQLTKKPKIPVITLWRKRDTGEYQNVFNHISFDRQDLGLSTNSQIKVLIVDAFCIHGNALKLAKEFLTKSIGKENVLIRTAAIFLRLGVVDRQTLPDFIVKETKNPVYAFGEEE